MLSQVGGNMSHSSWSVRKGVLNDEQRGPVTDCESERDQPSTRAETQQRSLAIFRSLISAPKCSLASQCPL